MPKPHLLGHVQFAVIGTGVLTVVLNILLLLGTGGTWWAFGFPRELAMYRLARAENYFYFGGCAYAPAQSWQLLRDQPNAAELFDSVATHANSAAGLVIAVAGLKAVSGGAMQDARTMMIAGHAGADRQPIVIVRAYVPDYRTDTVSLSYMLSQPPLDSVIALLQRPLKSAPDC
jgi:hypothetical protein